MIMNNDENIASTLVETAQSVDFRNVHSLKKVTEEINKTIGAVNEYEKSIKKMTPPLVNGEPWYKLAFGKASVTEVNKALESFSKFVQDTFKLVASSQQLQNENAINICQLIGMLAIAEKKSFDDLNKLAADLNALSTEDEHAAQQLKKFELDFLQSIEDASKDNITKEEQMSRLIDYITAFTESKTKKLHNITLTLSRINSRLNSNEILTERYGEDFSSFESAIISLYTKLIEVDNKIQESINSSIEQLVVSQETKLDDFRKEIQGSLARFVQERSEFIEQYRKKFESLDADISTISKHFEEVISALDTKTQNTIRVSAEQLSASQDQKNATEFEKVRQEMKNNKEEASNSLASLEKKMQDSIVQSSNAMAESLARESNALSAEQSKQFSNLSRQLEDSLHTFAEYRRKMKYILYALGTSSVAATAAAIFALVS